MIPALPAKSNGNTLKNQHISLQPFADHEKIDAAFLYSLGTRKTNDGYVIPYHDDQGNPLPHGVLVREAEGKFEASWMGGNDIPIPPYGLERLGDARREKFLCIVHGMKDCWVFWQAGFPALGIPGRDEFEWIKAEHIKSIDRIYVWKYPEAFGYYFEKKIKEHLTNIRYKGEIFTLSCKPFDDPKQLYSDNPEAFPERLKTYLKQAEPRETTPSGTTEDFAKKYMKCHAEAIPEPEDVNWLWKPRIARGAVTLIAGNPGVGKSTIAVDLAARITTGAGFPDKSPCPIGSVLLLTAEDDHKRIVARRLEEAGANRHKIQYVEYPNLSNLDKQIPDVESCLKARSDFVMMVIDPISLYVGDRINPHHQSDVAQLYARIGELAEKYNIAALIIAHLNKSTSQDTALFRVSGSIGNVSYARAVFMVQRDPSDPDKRLRYFSQAKNSYGPDNETFHWWFSGDEDSPRIEWDSTPLILTADEVLAMQSGGKESSSLDNAEAWLREILADGPVPVKQLEAWATRDGISWRTVERAKKSLGVRTKKDGLKQWLWYLDENQPENLKAAKSLTTKTWRSSTNLAVFNESSPEIHDEDCQESLKAAKAANKTNVGRLAVFNERKPSNTKARIPITFAESVEPDDAKEEF